MLLEKNLAREVFWPQVCDSTAVVALPQTLAVLGLAGRRGRACTRDFGGVRLIQIGRHPAFDVLDVAFEGSYGECLTLRIPHRQQVRTELVGSLEMILELSRLCVMVLLFKCSHLEPVLCEKVVNLIVVHCFLSNWS